MDVINESVEERKLRLMDTLYTRFHEGDLRGAERTACQYEGEFGGMFFFSHLGVKYEPGV